MIKYGMVTHMGMGVVLGCQPRHCICTNTLHSLLATGEFSCLFRVQ